jgi:hypothetical protein
MNTLVIPNEVMNRFVIPNEVRNLRTQKKISRDARNDS